jgi:hypothetical protein
VNYSIDWDGPGERDEARIVRCCLSPDHAQWKPDDFPGSDVALKKGCTCPADQPWPGALDFSSDCPLHELATPTS